MEPLIRDTLNSVQLTPKLTNCPAFVHDALAILAKGKSSNMPNGSQGHYFAIHLACLKYKLGDNLVSLISFHLGIQWN